MKKETPATATQGERNMTRRDRIKSTMERLDVKLPGVKFDTQGNIRKRLDIEVEPFDSGLIFENEAFLKYIIIQLRRYLEERLIRTDWGFTCFGNENLEDRWIVTEQFCEGMGIDFDFIRLLVEYLNYPACEGDFVNDFSVEYVLERVRNYREDGDDDDQEREIQ
jgi:hypothetical protein